MDQNINDTCISLWNKAATWRGTCFYPLFSFPVSCHWFIAYIQRAADETNLTLFNTTTDQSTTYPLLYTFGALPNKLRLKPKSYEVLALLPKFLKRLHPGSPEVKADLKRKLCWQALREVLEPLALTKVSDCGYAYVDINALSYTLTGGTALWVNMPAERSGAFAMSLLFLCCTLPVPASSLRGMRSLRRYVDLPEEQRLCGVKDCPDCVRSTGVARSDIDHEGVVTAAVAVMLAGTKRQAKDVLKDCDLSFTHLSSDCPFFGYIAHLTPSCFPADRLHLQYVDLHVLRCCYLTPLCSSQCVVSLACLVTC